MRKLVQLSAVTATAITAIAVTVACGPKQSHPPLVTPPPVDAGAPPPPIDAGPAAVADAGPVAFDAGGIPTLPVEATDTAIDLAIKALAAKDAPGMEPEGEPGRATLQPGGHFGMIITLQPNRCYTFIGYSPAGGVSHLDLTLLTPPLFNIPAGQSKPTQKNQPIIGQGKTALCPILPFPVAYKIDVGARQGAGRIGVVVFSRAK